MTTATHDKRVVLTIAVLAVFAASFAVVQFSSAAFTATTSSAENSWASGSVAIDDNMIGAAAFSVTNLVPGESVERCIVVTYTGTVDADVRSYLTGPETPDDLAGHLTVDVSSGAGLAGTSGTDGSCVDFASDQAYGEVPDLLSALLSDHGSFDDGLTPAWSITSPTPPVRRTYRIAVTLEDGAPQSESATAVFHWEAQSTTS